MAVITYLKRHDNAWLRAGLLITGVICLLVLVSCFYMPYDPTAMDRTAKSLGFSFRHLMGTDKFGRDIFCRVLYGTRVTLLIAIGTVSFGTFFGIVIGAAAGYFGGLADDIISLRREDHKSHNWRNGQFERFRQSHHRRDGVVLAASVRHRQSGAK